jgi:hypothetical protein
MEPQASSLLAAFHDACDAVIWVLEVQALMLHTTRWEPPVFLQPQPSPSLLWFAAVVLCGGGGGELVAFALDMLL